MTQPAAESDAARWQAVLARDQRQDGRFVYAVASTHIYCRPSCPARRPARAHVRFFTSGAAAQAAGYRACRRCRPDGLSQDRQAVERVIAALGKAGGRVVPMAELAALTGYSAGHLRVVFQRATGITPAAHARALRLGAGCKALGEGAAVMEAVMDAGYEGATGFYSAARGCLGLSPAVWRKGGAGATIRWGVAQTRFGAMLVAATERGLCRLAFGEGREELARHFPKAELVAGDDAFVEMLTLVVKAVENRADPGFDVPLDVMGSAFQHKVWQALRAIPPGQTRSYADIAKAIGQPGAARAVGQANARNPVAVLVPCHRVVGAGGGLGGYAWGPAVKRALLAEEGCEISDMGSLYE